MQYLYVELTPEYVLQDMIDEIVMGADTITDRSTHTKYLKVGSGYDIETSKIEVDKTLFGIDHTAYCYHWQFGLGEWAFLGRSLESMSNFLNMLIPSIKVNRPKHKLLVFDANLGYEWQFCKHYWHEFGITKLFAKEKRDPILIEVDYTLQFREVIGLFGNSLAQIAKNYCGIKKLVGDLDFTKVRLSETPMDDTEIGYTVRDVEILVILAEKYVYENFFGSKPRLPYTSTGIVRDAIKRELGSGLKAERNKIASWMPTEYEYELFRKYLFKGGISGCNIIHMNKVFRKSDGKAVKGADITSDYPYQMLTKLYPMGKAVVDSNENFCKTNKPYIAIVLFKKFQAKTSHALMSSHKALNSKEMSDDDRTVLDNNRIQYAEEVKLCINDVEYKSLKKAYKWKKCYILKCWVFPDGYKKLPQHIIKTCLKQYLIKQSLKKDFSDTQEYRDAKAFVNSIFGMMCTALFREDWIFDEKECDITIEEDENGKKITTPYEDCCKYLFLSPYWGFWITSYAREMLIDVITRFPKIIIQYDTDSVYFITGTDESNKLEEYLQFKNRQMELLNSTLFAGEKNMLSLGTWDFTEPFLRYKGLGAKRYMYEYIKDGKKKIKVTVTGCRTVKDEKSEYYEQSTMVLQNDINNKKNGTNVDIFDFFRNGMKIDKEYTYKLASHYVENEVVVDYEDYQHNHEVIDCKSAIVLSEVEFNLSVKKKHLALADIAQRYMENGTDWRIYNVWKELKRLSL